MKILVTRKAKGVEYQLEQLKCDRCGKIHGSHKGLRTITITEGMEVAGKLWDICSECQSKLIPL